MEERAVLEENILEVKNANSSTELVDSNDFMPFEEELDPLNPERKEKDEKLHLQKILNRLEEELDKSGKKKINSVYKKYIINEELTNKKIRKSASQCFLCLAFQLFLPLLEIINLIGIFIGISILNTMTSVLFNSVTSYSWFQLGGEYHLNFYKELYEDSINQSIDFDVMFFMNFLGDMLLKSRGFVFSSTVFLVINWLCFLWIYNFTFKDNIEEELEYTEQKKEVETYTLFNILYILGFFLLLFVGVGGSTMLSQQILVDSFEKLNIFSSKKLEKERRKEEREEQKKKLQKLNRVNSLDYMKLIKEDKKDKIKEERENDDDDDDDDDEESVKHEEEEEEESEENDEQKNENKKEEVKKEVKKEEINIDNIENKNEEEIISMKKDDKEEEKDNIDNEKDETENILEKIEEVGEKNKIEAKDDKDKKEEDKDNEDKIEDKPKNLSSGKFNYFFMVCITTIIGYLGKYYFTGILGNILFKDQNEKDKYLNFFLYLIIVYSACILLSIIFYGIFDSVFKYKKKKEEKKEDAFSVYQILGFTIYRETLNTKYESPHNAFCLLCESIKDCCDKIACYAICNFILCGSLDDKKKSKEKKEDEELIKCCCCCCCPEYEPKDYHRNHVSFCYCYEERRANKWLHSYLVNQTQKDLIPYMIQYFFLRAFVLEFDKAYDERTIDDTNETSNSLILFGVSFLFFFYITFTFSFFNEGMKIKNFFKNDKKENKDEGGEKTEEQKKEEEKKRLEEEESEKWLNIFLAGLVGKDTKSAIFSQNILNGTTGILLVNGLYSFILSSKYLAKSFDSNDKLEDALKKDYYAMFPVLLNKYYYFTLIYFCLTYTEGKESFELISGATLISLYISAFDFIVSLIQLLGAKGTIIFQLIFSSFIALFWLLMIIIQIYWVIREKSIKPLIRQLCLFLCRFFCMCLIMVFFDENKQCYCKCCNRLFCDDQKDNENDENQNIEVIKNEEEQKLVEEEKQQQEEDKEIIDN